MVLQHPVRYHEARDWIRHQDQSQLTCQALLSHCKMLKSQCEQFQKAKERGSCQFSLYYCHYIILTYGYPMSISPKYHCKKCGYSLSSTPSVQPKVNSAIHVLDTITSQHCASREVTDRQPSRPHEEATSLQDAVLAVIAELHIIPATPHAGTAAIVLTIVALPGPLPTVPNM